MTDTKKIKRKGGGYAAKYGEKIIDWDVALDRSYFDELFRIDDKRIFFDGNGRICMDINSRERKDL